MINLKNLPFINPSVLKSRIIWSINLRWFAIIGVSLAILFAKYSFQFELPYRIILYILGCLIFTNLIYLGISKYKRDPSVSDELTLLSIHISADIILLTLLIHFSGGLENPFYLFYIFHIIISSILFPFWVPFLFAMVIIILFSTVILLEYFGIIAHYTLFYSKCFQNPDTIAVLLTVFIVTIIVTAYISYTFIKSYRKVKQEIDKKNKQLEEQNIEKTKYFNFASHELKSPIIAIKSTLDAIINSYENEMPERVVNVLSRSSSRADQMLAMIGELLDISKKQINNHIEEADDISANEIILQVIQQASSLLNTKKIKVKINLDNKVPTIRGIKYDFVQIFNNLIYNAIHYTPEGGKISIKSTYYPENGKLRFKISDTGIGIEKEDLTKIFQEFYRAENAKKAVNFGTGLGLSLVKQIISEYEGEIIVDSVPGKGSSFIIWFESKREVSEK